jgi:hypothetical protein
VGWSVLGLVASGIIALIAFRRSRAPGGFYDADVYEMTAANHRTYAGVFIAFGAAFSLSIPLGTGTLRFWLLASFAFVAIFYLTSFLRGAHEDDG